MLTDIPYDREKALAYVEKWVFNYNPQYYNFEKIGGDCTNFASQAIYAGCGVMNYDTYGWYYIDVNRRAPAWSGVEFLGRFLLNNNGCGPFGECVDLKDIVCGDLIQLSLKGQRFEHCLIVVDIKEPLSFENILVSTHSKDVHFHPLSTYKWWDIRFLHIIGARKM
ncbi:MAG: amidase domain-containing protein [Peptococcaceae bacterium]|nr:amidase domain-containing protein [Peptococcaceae bacterium]